MDNLKEVEQIMDMVVRVNQTVNATYEDALLFQIKVSMVRLLDMKDEEAQNKLTAGGA